MSKKKFEKRIAKMSDAEKESFMIEMQLSTKAQARLARICNECKELANWEDLFNIGAGGISVEYPEEPCETCIIRRCMAQ